MNNKVLKNKTLAVIIITLATMIAEIYFGYITHSMGLLADGFHMGTHALALFITFVICIFALKFSGKEEKFNALGGFISAIFLGLTSIGIIYESVERMINPLKISFNEAILVAIIGLVVNLICVLIMGENHSHSHEHEHEHHHENLNYKAAYLHILADAFTSILAITALVLGKYFNLIYFDPFIGILGGIIIAKWSINLIKSSSKILLSMK